MKNELHEKKNMAWFCTLLTQIFKIVKITPVVERLQIKGKTMVEIKERVWHSQLVEVFEASEGPTGVLNSSRDVIVVQLPAERKRKGLQKKERMDGKT